MKFNLFVGTVCSALFMSLAAANSMAQVSDPYGTVASQALPDRIVQVDGGTKFINVHQGGACPNFCVNGVSFNS